MITLYKCVIHNVSTVFKPLLSPTSTEIGGRTAVAAGTGLLTGNVISRSTGGSLQINTYLY